MKTSEKNSNSIWPNKRGKVSSAIENKEKLKQNYKELFPDMEDEQFIFKDACEWFFDNMQSI